MCLCIHFYAFWIAVPFSLVNHQSKSRFFGSWHYIILINDMVQFFSYMLGSVIVSIPGGSFTSILIPLHLLPLCFWHSNAWLPFYSIYFQFGICWYFEKKILYNFIFCSWTGKAGPRLSVEALEKMMEDPTVQKMVYP